MEVCVEEDKTVLKLHDNIIAILRGNNDLEVSTAGWNTNTTRNRLNALPGVHVTSRNGELKLNGQLWDGKLIKL